MKRCSTCRPAHDFGMLFVSALPTLAQAKEARTLLGAKGIAFRNKDATWHHY